MAFLHDGDPVGDSQRLLLVVGDVDGGDAQAALELLDNGAHLHPQLGVQIGKGFVHQQDAGLDDKGPGQGDTLLLTAGQLIGLAVSQVGNLHQLQGLVHLGLDLPGGHFPGLQAVGHVFPDGEVGENRVVLEHHADVPLVGGHVVDPLVTKVEVTALDGVEAGDHPQQRGFAAAGGAEEREEFALLNVQRNAVQRGKVAVALHGVLDNDSIAHMVSSRIYKKCFARFKHASDKPASGYPTHVSAAGIPQGGTLEGASRSK